MHFQPEQIDEIVEFFEESAVDYDKKKLEDPDFIAMMEKAVEDVTVLIEERIIADNHPRGNWILKNIVMIF